MTAPRWKTAIDNALNSDKKANVIQLASVDTTTASAVPRVRSLVFRQFLTPASAPPLSLLLTTTDVRTPKASQLLASPRVEIVWWMESKQEQFRISGSAHIIPAITHPLYKDFRSTKEGAGMQALGSQVGFNWEEKRKESFNEMSGHMKATWCRPVPGTKLKGGYEEAKKWPQKLPPLGEAVTEEDIKNTEIALQNFALLVVEPDQVDYVELGIVPNQRTVFTRKQEDRQWNEDIVVP